MSDTKFIVVLYSAIKNNMMNKKLKIKKNKAAKWMAIKMIQNAFVQVCC